MMSKEKTEGRPKMRAATVAAVLLMAGMAHAKDHTDSFPVPCKVLWAAVDDALSNSGKYDGVVENQQAMTATYKIGGELRKYSAYPIPRDNAVALSSNGGACTMTTRSHYTGLIHNDYGDFVARVRVSLARVKAEPAPAPIAKPAGSPVVTVQAPPRTAVTVQPIAAGSSVYAPVNTPLDAPAASSGCKNEIVDKGGHHVCFD